MDPAELQVQFPPGQGAWSEIKLSRGLLWVNGKAVKEASWGSPGSSARVKIKDINRTYPGKISISVRPEKAGPGLCIINEVPLRDYAACVLAFESGYDRSQPEYLKALGVLVRSYASAHRRRHPGYDLCDLSHCQVYQGLPPHGEFWLDLIEACGGFRFPPATDGSSLYFHRCCGGVLESSDRIWGGKASPSRTGPDEVDGETLCRSDSFFHWDSCASVEMMESILKSMAHLPSNAHLSNLRITVKTPHQRNKTLSAAFDSPEGSKEIRENVPKFVSEFGKKYGWRVFPSLWFDFKRENDLFKFTGRGFGHGVGLCQSGALRLAELGWNWERILGFYFPESSSGSNQRP